MMSGTAPAQTMLAFYAGENAGVILRTVIVQMVVVVAVGWWLRGSVLWTRTEKGLVCGGSE